MITSLHILYDGILYYAVTKQKPIGRPERQTNLELFFLIFGHLKGLESKSTKTWQISFFLESEEIKNIWVATPVARVSTEPKLGPVFPHHSPGAPQSFVHVDKPTTGPVIGRSEGNFGDF